MSRTHPRFLQTYVNFQSQYFFLSLNKFFHKSEWKTWNENFRFLCIFCVSTMWFRDGTLSSPYNIYNSGLMILKLSTFLSAFIILFFSNEWKESSMCMKWGPKKVFFISFIPGKEEKKKVFFACLQLFEVHLFLR